MLNAIYADVICCYWIIRMHIWYRFVCVLNHQYPFIVYHIRPSRVSVCIYCVVLICQFILPFWKARILPTPTSPRGKELTTIGALAYYPHFRIKFIAIIWLNVIYCDYNTLMNFYALVINSWVKMPECNWPRFTEWREWTANLIFSPLVLRTISKALQFIRGHQQQNCVYVLISKWCRQ